MAYPNPNIHGNGYPQQYPVIQQYHGYIDPRQMNRPPANGYTAYDSNSYHSNGQIDPRSAYSNASNGIHHQQHAPPPPPQQHRPSQPQLQQARAVAIPALSPAPVSHARNAESHKTLIQGQTPAAPPLDYQLLLLSMAEEYFAAAYGRGSVADIVRRETEMQEYYKLIATGLGCLEALLKHYKLDPEREANVLLRYATVLYEETENAMEAEEALSKGISICNRHRFFDLKYNMQHLLARVVFQKNPKAAFKFLDRALQDAQAYQHIAWVYALRFLRVSLHLELNSHQDLSAALSQLRGLITVASEHGDKAILATATTLEALICLKDSSDSEGFEQAQRALASVRSLQMDPSIGNIPQLSALTSFADISCHLQRFDPVQALSSMQNMQNTLARVLNGASWDKNGSFAIPVSNLNIPHTRSENGVIKQKADGSFVLMFNWLPNDDIYNIGFLLSGIAMAHKNTADNQKSERMFSEGIQRQDHAQKSSNKVAKSVLLATKQQSWREQMAYYMRIYLAFALAARTSWTSAKEQVFQLKKLHNSWPDVPNDLFLLSQYLKATIAQGTGDLVSAFSIYHEIAGSITDVEPPQSVQQSHIPQLDRELSLLSTLNTLLIIHNPSHSNYTQCASLLDDIAPFCTRSPNRNILSAYHILAAVLPEASKILLTKTSLHHALEAAKLTSNNQLMCMVLNIMSWKFFSGVVGEQAEKSARASQQLAKKGKDALWLCVASGVLAGTLEAAGRIEESTVAEVEGERYAKELPQPVQEAMIIQEDSVMSGMNQLYETAMDGQLQ